MSAHILPAFVVFGVLLVIAIIGLLKSNASSERLHGSTHAAGQPTDGRVGGAYPDAMRR